MIDWKRYALRDIPIAGFPYIDVHSRDDRINGKKFYEPVVRSVLEELWDYVRVERNPIFLVSPEVVLGTGKSAVLASQYWKLADAAEICLWVQVTAFSPMRTILLKVADEMARSGLIRTVQRKLRSAGSLESGIKRFSSDIPSHPALISWATKAFSRPDIEFPFELANVKRQTQVFGVQEAFSFVLDVCKAITKKRIFVFLDQLEIYVISNRATQVAAEFNELIRGITDKGLLLGTLHTDALVKLETECGPYVETFLKTAPKVELRPFTQDDCIDVGSFWLGEFRTRSVDKYYPFTKDAMSEIAKKCQRNVRRFLITMRAALMYGALSGYPKIDEKFLSSETARSRVFIAPVTVTRAR